MSYQRAFRTCLVPVCAAVAALALVIPFWVTAAPGSSGTVQQVTVGTYVTFTGSGFQANEQLSLWADPPNGGATIPLDGTQADGNGGFSISVSFPSAGLWQVTAQGNTSGTQYVGQFSVGTTAPSASAPVSSGTATSPTASTSTTTTGSPSPATSAGTVPAGLPPGTQATTIGATVTFSGSGFSANEFVNIWVTGPDATVTPLPTISADANGGANGNTAFNGGGLWQVTMHGKDSAHEVVARFYVPGGTIPSPTSSTSTSTTSSATTTTGSVPPGLPPGTQATAVGTSVTFSANGFNPNEAIGVWVTGPDSTVTPLNSGFADNTGSMTGTTAFASGGLWQVTIHGKDSGHEVVDRFYVTGDATSSTSTGTATTVTGPSSNGSVAKVQASQRVTFTVTGFTANEVVSVWTTSPEGTVSQLDATTANSTGRVLITTTFPSAGLWSITAHGQSSGHEAVGQYQVSLPATS
jgi:hypothetical protein